MKLSAFKQCLEQASQLNFVLPDGAFVPRHFHITEAGLTNKHFIDCGGTVRTEKNISFQLWVATDYQHRLAPEKLLKIITLSERLFNDEDLEIEIEYQTETIGRFGLDFNGHHFLLTTKQTNCLAKDQCGLPPAKTRLQLADLSAKQNSCCQPGSGCC